MQDFSRQYETEALLHMGEEPLAREELLPLREHLGLTRRFRIPYLRSLAILAAWEGQREQAISHLREAAELAAEIGLPGEQWQIQAALGRVYEAGGEFAQAHTAFEEAATIFRGWLRASRMLHCARAFWLDHRFTRCCSVPNALLF